VTLIFDVHQALRQAEEYLRRNIKSKAVRAAEKRRLERKTQEAMRRVGRSVALMGASGAGVVGYGMAVAPIGVTGLVAAGTATFIAASASLMLPSRKRRRDDELSAADLDELIAEAEDWLLRKRPTMPVRTLAPFDAIIARLHDLTPHLAGLNPAGPLAGEVRRLVGAHLPRLVDSYLGLPAPARDAAAERGLIDGLVIVSDELTRLCREIGHDSLFTFETQRRFIETRYRDGG